MSEAKPVLIIDRGDLPSLTALALEPQPEQVILWHPMGTDAAARSRKRVCETKTKRLGVRRLLTSAPYILGLPDMPPPVELHQVSMLIQASTIANQLKCSRIIWPKQVGPDFEQMGELMDRANLVVDLAGNGDLGRGPSIDLPLVDLTDEHLVDLLEESGCPLDLFWPCDGGESSPCGACRGCTRWIAAFEVMGVSWPWAVVQTT